MRWTAVGGVVLVALLVSVLATGIGSAQSAESEANVSFGAEVSSFMQASGAATESELEDGMFDAALNRTSEPEERRALIEERKQRLEQRHELLQSQRRTLDGESGVRTHAVATQITVGAAKLEHAANDTEALAGDGEIDRETLQAIRSSARELRGSDVAAFARGSDGQPGGIGGSAGNVADPSSDTPPGNDSTSNSTVESAVNDTTAPVANATEDPTDINSTATESAANRPVDDDRSVSPEADEQSQSDTDDERGPRGVDVDERDPSVGNGAANAVNDSTGIWLPDGIGQFVP